MSTESVSDWLLRLQQGETAAAQKLWDRFFPRLVRLARGRLAGLRVRGADEEDVALSAFDSFCRAVTDGRLPSRLNGENLWALLVVIASRKVSDHKQFETRQKRGGGRVVLQTDLAARGDAGEGSSLFEQIIGREATPEFAAQMTEECDRLLKALADPELEAIALWKMEGLTNDEIATRLGCVRRTVERRLQVIRSLWLGEDE